MGWQTAALDALFPGECLTCPERVEASFAFCPACWAEAPFVLGPACDLCGAGLPGVVDPAEGRLICDDCRAVPRPWQRGRSVFAYAGTARRLVLGLKHGDRTDVARAAGPWMARAGADLLTGDPVLVPVPLHWLRLARRRYNQAALLAQALGRAAGVPVVEQALTRVRRTPVLDGVGRTARAAALDGAIAPHPRHAAALAGRSAVIVDDVMTSGATLAAATAAAVAAGARGVQILTLARAGRDT